MGLTAGLNRKGAKDAEKYKRKAYNRGWTQVNAKKDQIPLSLPFPR